MEKQHTGLTQGMGCIFTASQVAVRCIWLHLKLQWGAVDCISSCSGMHLTASQVAMGCILLHLMLQLGAFYCIQVAMGCILLHLKLQWGAFFCIQVAVGFIWLHLKLQWDAVDCIWSCNGVHLTASQVAGGAFYCVPSCSGVHFTASKLQWGAFDCTSSCSIVAADNHTVAQKNTMHLTIFSFSSIVFSLRSLVVIIQTGLRKEWACQSQLFVSWLLLFVVLNLMIFSHLWVVVPFSVIAALIFFFIWLEDIQLMNLYGAVLPKENV